MFTIGNLIWVLLLVVAVVYFVVPTFRSQVNDLVATLWGGFYNRTVTPLARQKKQLADAMELLKQQKAAVVSIIATASQAEAQLPVKNQAIRDAIEAYRDGKRFQFSEAELDQLAEKVAAARKAAIDQQETVRKANANMARALQVMEQTRATVESFSQTVLGNQGKVELTSVLNLAAQARELATSLNDSLSTAGAATAEIDQALAEAEVRNEFAEGDPLMRKLKAQREQEALKKEREALDGQAKA